MEEQSLYSAASIFHMEFYLFYFTLGGASGAGIERNVFRAADYMECTDASGCTAAIPL